MKALKRSWKVLIMLDKGFIEKTARDIAGIKEKPVTINKLKGDASNRSYYRIKFSRDTQQCAPANQDTMILMELAEPEAFKKSEEKISVSTMPVTELPYINILNHLAKCNVGVPRLFHYEKEKGLLFLEDLGDMLLEERVKGSSSTGCKDYYKKAIDELIKIHTCATKTDDKDCIAFGRGFDIPLLMWEFDHFIEYGIEDARGMKIPENDRKAMMDIFYSISDKLAKEPRVFTHRDYHSRNLMIHNDKIRVLDFQDALMGPCQYDLASFLRDSYIALPEDMIDELLEYYISKKEAVDGIKINRKNFRELFDLMSIQRNLKAAGRFAYINSVKKKDFYLQFIPQTLGYVKRNLKKYSGLKELHKLLSKYVEELR